MLEKRLLQIGQDRIARLLEAGAPFISRQAVERDLDITDIALVNELIEGKHLYQDPPWRTWSLQRLSRPPLTPPLRGQYRRHGEELLRRGTVAALVVAGGQGSRLGIDAPKGVVGVSPVRSKSLFQIHAEKVLPSRGNIPGPFPCSS